MAHKFVFLALFAILGLHFSLSAQINFKPVEGFSCGSYYKFLAVGDLNNDRRDDVVVATDAGASAASSDYSLYMFLQGTNGALNSPNRIKYSNNEQGLSALAVGDVNNDGLQDIVVGLWDTMKVFIQKNDHSFSLDKKWAGGRFVDNLRIGDFNNDGLQDIVASHFPDDELIIYYQKPDKSFLTKSYIMPAGGRNQIELGDLNCDGRTDILLNVGQINNGLFIFLQGDDGLDKNYLAVRLPTSTNVFGGAKIGDVNNDGLNDVVATIAFNSPNSKLYIWHQNPATHTFKPPIIIETHQIPEKVTIGDFDNDKRNDIAIAHGGWQVYTIYSQNCTKNYTEILRGPLPSNSFYRQIETAVVGNDGKTDLVVGSSESKFFFLDNDSKPRAQRLISSTGTTRLVTDSIVILDSLKTFRTDTVGKWIVKTTTVTTFKNNKTTIREHNDSTFIVFDSVCMRRDTLIKKKCLLKSVTMKMDTSVQIRYDTAFWTAVSTLPFRDTDVTIHPNPATQQLFFKVENPLSRPVFLCIYAFDGRLVSRQKTVLQTDNVLPISTLPSGLYFLEIKDDVGRVAKRFVVRN